MSQIKTTDTAATNTPVNVAQTATTHADIALSKLTLLGTFGTDAAPKALVRLPDGAIATLIPGDTLGAQTVIAIDHDRLGLGRGGTAYWLTLP